MMKRLLIAAAAALIAAPALAATPVTLKADPTDSDGMITLGDLFDGAGVPETPFNLGQRVRHSLFGEGTILNFEGSGAQARVQVNFEDEGSKWLMLSYAKLEAL